MPSPEHSGQAPNGALNENVRGSISGLVDEVHLNETVGEAEGRLERVREPAEHVGTGDEPVDHDRDVVLHLLLQHRRLVEPDHLAVDDRAGVAPRRQLPEEVDELALLLRHDGAQHLVADAIGQLHELVGDLLHRLPLDALTAHGTVRYADTRPEQAHVVVDLGDRADRRARVAVRRLLVDGDRRAQALDEVDVGAVYLTEELARVGRERLDVASLPLGEDRVEREGGLSRPRKAREDDHGVARDLDIDVLQVVHAGTADTQARVGIET